VNDGVSGGKDHSIFSREAKSIGADITGDRGNSSRAHVIKRLVRGGVVFPQAVESIVSKNFSSRSASGRGAAAISNEEDEFAIRYAA
jgi:hypothetical protein